MNYSSYLFGFILATLLGALFHLWRNGGVVRLLLFLVFSWIGFFVGHTIANYFGFNFFSVGPLNIVGGIVGSIAFLLLGNWIAKIEPNQDTKK